MMYNYPFFRFRRDSVIPPPFATPKTNVSKTTPSHYTNCSTPAQIPSIVSTSALKEQKKLTSLKPTENFKNPISNLLGNFLNQDDRDEDEQCFEIFGIKLYFDDILLICLIFFLYKEEVKDQYLFFALILLLLS